VYTKKQCTRHVDQHRYNRRLTHAPTHNNDVLQSICSTHLRLEHGPATSESLMSDCCQTHVRLGTLGPAAQQIVVRRGDNVEAGRMALEAGLAEVEVAVETIWIGCMVAVGNRACRIRVPYNRRNCHVRRSHGTACYTRWR
jgi:hypothetical protein